MKWLCVALLTIPACKIERQPAGVATHDNFDRATVGDNYVNTGGNYRIVDGALVTERAFNHPLWLKAPLPKDAVIEMDAWSEAPYGDIKFEAWGDGHSAATEATYTATSYVFIFGGWHNQISAIARMHEHGKDRRTRTDIKVEPHRHYHFKVTRQGGHIDWQIDGQPFLTFDDPEPLAGADHAYLAFNTWEAELHFDNLVVTPLP
jgi:hypothetical protein